MALVVQRSRFLHYNAGAFVSGGEACLVDPGITRDEVAELVERLGGAEIRFVTLTHADWDHVLGPESLPPATIVAHEAFAADLDPDGTRAQLARLEGSIGIGRSARFDPPLPGLTFVEETTLEFGELELRLAHAPGHAASMLTVYEPAAGQLWAADVLSDIEIPSVVHDLVAYERTLDRLAQLEARTLVPGHGTPTDDSTEIARRLEEDRRYLAELHARVDAAVAAGASLEEAVEACARIELRRAPEDDLLHRLNVEKAYADLGGDADPGQVGYAAAWKALTRP